MTIDILLNAINKTGWKAVMFNPGLEVGSQNFRRKMINFLVRTKILWLLKALDIHYFGA